MANDKLVVTLTVDQLDELIAKASRRALTELAGKSEPEVLDLKGCAALLLRSTKKIQELVETQGLPTHYVGHNPRFLRSEVLEWLKKQGEKNGDCEAKAS